MTGGWGGARERERELSVGIRIHGEQEKRKSGWRGGGGGGPTLEKEDGFQFQTSQRMNWKTGVPVGNKNISQMQRKPYVINLDEGFTVTEVGKTKQPKRERCARTLSHIHTCAYTHYCSSVVGYSEDIGGSGGGGRPTYSTAYLQPRKIDASQVTAKYGYSLSFIPPGFLLPSLSIKCDSMSFLSFTLSVKRSHSPFT